MNINCPEAFTHWAEPSMKTSFAPDGKTPPFLWAGILANGAQLPWVGPVVATTSAASIMEGLAVAVLTGLATLLNVPKLFTHLVKPP